VRIAVGAVAIAAVGLVAAQNLAVAAKREIDVARPPVGNDDRSGLPVRVDAECSRGERVGRRTGVRIMDDPGLHRGVIPGIGVGGESVPGCRAGEPGRAGHLGHRLGCCRRQGQAQDVGGCGTKELR
jgi:hypothetical protein